MIAAFRRYIWIDIQSAFILCLKVFGAFRVAINMLLMWNSKIQIDGGGNTVVTASVLEVRNLVVLRVRWFNLRAFGISCTSSVNICQNRGPTLVHCFLQHYSVISSNANLGVYGQGLLKLSGHGDTIKGQRLSLSLFYNITVSHWEKISNYKFLWGLTLFLFAL